MLKEIVMKGSKRCLIIVSFLLLTIASFAVPAKPGLTRILTLTDGTTVTAILVGDEHGHFWKGTDGKAYQMVAGTDTYQEVNSQEIIQRAQQKRAQANSRRSKRLAPRRVGEVGGGITGDKKGIIILVNFADQSFTATQSDFNNLANTVNYNSGNFKGSMYDYFYAQSEGQFRLTFDVVGPYTVSKDCSYYGSNDSQGNDEHPAEMVIEALKLADGDVNYADYDWDGDKEVDQVYVVYAGKGAADGGAATTIWPHEWQLSSAKFYGDGTGAQTLDGVKINTYACGGELNGSTGDIAGIGTMCHEFSHCLGYPDFYDTDYSGGQGMGYWDLMDSGSYNDDGYQPSGYTSYERWVAGWKTPIELEYTQTISNMAALQTNGSNAYIIYNKGNRNEYYLLENRQKIGWDASLPGAGLLILHVDYNSSIWSNNTVNDKPSRQRMTWIAADNEYQYTTYQGTKYYTFSGMANDPFPYGNVNAFSKNTTPAATLYNKNSDNTYYLDSSVEEITQNGDGTISFDFVGISNFPIPTISPNGGRFAYDQTVTVNITAEDGATIYYTTDGSKPTTLSTTYTAPFTLNATTTVKAIAAKNDVVSNVAEATYTFLDPLIIADESLSFATGVGSSQTQSLTVLTEGLTQDVTLTLSDANNVFSLETNTISKSQEYATVDVTFSPTVAGNYMGTITLSSAGAESVTVQLTATATLAALSTPTDLTLSDVTSSSFTASWTAVDGAASYEIDVVQGSSFEASAGGPVLEADFSSTTGWTLSGTGTYTGTGYYGNASPSIKFDGTGDYAISPDFDSGVKLQFWALGNSGNGSTFAISGLVNGTWTDIQTVNIAMGGATYEVDLPAGTSQVRFDFTKSVNCALDDVVIYGAGNSPVSLDGYPKSVGNATSTSISGLTPETQYAVRVRAVNGGGNSDWSSTVSTTTAIANSAPVWSALPTNVSITVGDEYELTISDYVSGIPIPTISMTASDSDDADYDDGYFLFIPTEAGTFNFTFTATNSEGSANATLTVIVNPAPVTVPTLAVTDVTSTTAPVSWDACDGVTNYTLQLATDDEFTADSPSQNVTLVKNTATSTTAPTDWTYNISSNSSSYLILFKGNNVITKAFDTSDCIDLSLSLEMRTYNGTNHPSITIQYSTDNGSTWSTSLGTLSASNNNMASRTLNLSSAVGYPSVRLRIASTSTSTSVGVGIKNIVITGTQSANDGSLISSTTVNGTSYTFTGLTPETTYYARVKGNADWSNVVDFTTNATFTLANDADNGDAISTAATSGKTYDVTLADRTLWKDGDWNTLCLPFSFSAEQIAASDLADADIRALSSASFNGGTLTLNFTDENVTTAIAAGTPYIIKWAGNGTNNIVNPVFTGVTISNANNNVTCDLGNGNTISFKGTYEQLSYTNDDTSILFLGTANTLYYPVSNATIGAQRAYFELTGITAGEPKPGQSNITAFQLCFDGETDGIRTIDNGQLTVDNEAGAWYDLSGRKVSLSPIPSPLGDGRKLPRGIYIHNGRKVVIK